MNVSTPSASSAPSARPSGRAATALVLAGTGRTGSRLAARLTARGLTVRTAARRGADVPFDWDDPATHRPALAGADRLYLVPPVMRVDYAGQVAAFLDLAEHEGVRHVTYLSAYGIDRAAPQVALRAVELDLAARGSLSHTVLRPAWFMQNFSETFLKPMDDVITVPTGDGAEAFVDAEDIAAVAAATLADPDAHAGAAYALTGPEALTVGRAAGIIADVTGRPVTYRDIDRDEWIRHTVAAGVPAAYGAMLRTLTETVAAGLGSRPTGDVEKVTGVPPIPFTAFARRTARAWR
ncbi:NmrA family NAD(P)-binding protein [Actinacidiphila acididurans]|uniref:NmrA family NAD(P)-binding protein n=1 Tax=Actinacidiphila acididurans TaxID=2784346 RepID=A0ABS2TUQ2_9ACTN|nr:NmrA family NAD(P)-binding protein [Actinacidiphila acididurans]MBM9506557.1 NmrA family NAD(P)-binding protein [Actinacidiphila acididurans]